MSDVIEVDIQEHFPVEIIEVHVDENAAQSAIDAAALAQQTLQQVQDALASFNIVNTIYVNNSFTKVGQIFKGNAGTQWNINGLNYTNPTDQEITIPLCATGKVRTDRIVLDTNNNFVRVQGVEVTNNPVAQSKPVNTLDYTFIPVTDSVVGVPTSPIVGTDVVKKSFANMFEFNGTGADAVIPLHPSGYSEIRLINADLTSISGVDLSLMTGTNFELPYIGKPIIFWNRTGGNVTLTHEDFANATYPLFLTQLSNVIFPNNHFVIFKWDAGGLYQVDKNFFSIAEIIGLTTALSAKLDKVSTVDVDKVYVKNANGTQGMKPVSELGGEAYNSQYDFTHFYRGGCGFLNNFGSIETGQMYSPLNYGLHGIALKTAANNTPSGLKTSPVGNMNGFTVWGQFYFYELTMSDFFSTIGFLPFSTSYAYIEIDSNTKKIRAKTSLNGVVTTSPDSTYTVLANVMYLFIYEYISISEIKFKVLLETTKEVVFSYTSTTNIPALGQYGHFGFQQQRNPNTFAQMTMLVFDSFGMAVKKPNFLNNF